MKKIVLFTFCLMSSCASLKSVSVTRIPQNRSNPVKVETWTWGIFGLYGDNDFADDAVNQLKDKCPNGKLSGVFTKYSNRNFVLWTTRKVNLSAYCEKS